MILSPRWTPEAEKDLHETVRWYEARQSGLGEEFIVEVETVAASVEESPARFPLIHGVVRRAVLHRFPYAIFYFEENGVTTIIGLFHFRRDPVQWRRDINES